MKVSCPNCETKYNLPDERIAAGGTKVKCSKCKHVFTVAPPPATPEEEVEQLLEEPKVEGAPAAAAKPDFDAAFEETVAAEGAKAEAPGAEAPEEPAEAAAEEGGEEIPPIPAGAEGADLFKTLEEGEAAG